MCVRARVCARARACIYVCVNKCMRTLLYKTHCRFC